jgi:chemotaxis protein histidine kinase CheA
MSQNKSRSKKQQQAAPREFHIPEPVLYHQEEREAEPESQDSMASQVASSLASMFATATEPSTETAEVAAEVAEEAAAELQPAAEEKPEEAQEAVAESAEIQQETQQGLAGRVAALKHRGFEVYSQLKSKASETLELAEVKVNVARVHLSERMTQTRASLATNIEKGQATAQRIVEPLLFRATRKAVRESYGRLRTVGVRTWSAETAANARQAAKYAAISAAEQAQSTASHARVKTTELGHTALEVVKDAQFQATAAGALSGAATLGAGAGATGLATGTVLGAAAGILPAFFTFGLSIPIGAALGGGAGLFVGAAVGSAAGAAGGGAAGYKVHANRHLIQAAKDSTIEKVSSGAEYVRGRAFASAGFMKEKAAEVRTRLVGGTGGTETSSD